MKEITETNPPLWTLRVVHSGNEVAMFRSDKHTLMAVQAAWEDMPFRDEPITIAPRGDRRRFSVRPNMIASMMLLPPADDTPEESPS